MEKLNFFGLIKMNKNTFRIWDNFEKRFLPYPCWVNIENGEEFMAFDRYFDFKKEGCVLQQFIGILDKNMRRIYEGDIVKFKYALHEHDYEESIGEVHFLQGVYYFDRDLMFATNDPNFCLESVEVIGNILEDYIYNEDGKLVKKEKIETPPPTYKVRGVELLSDEEIMNIVKK
jgi:hypothetical protein